MEGTAPSFDIVLPRGKENISVDLEGMFQSPSAEDSRQQLQELVDMMTKEQVPVQYWIQFIHECWNHERYSTALFYADQAIKLHPRDQVPILCLKANYHLALSRRAPKMRITTPRSTGGGGGGGGGGGLALPKDPHHPESQFAQTVWPASEPHRRGPQGELPPPMVKEDYWFRAGKDLERARDIERDNKVVRDLEATLLVARGRLDEANRLFEQILVDEPNHLMALTGRARFLFSRLSFRPALKLYQQVLQLEPTFLPDPRIGIGLCFWFLGDREKAKKAWERSIAVNPSNSTSASTLLGLLHLNRSRDPLLPGGSPSRTRAYEIGIGLIQQAFKKDNTLAAAMGPLGNHFLIQNQGGRGVESALKLYERSLQFSETRLLIAESHYNLARALDADPDGLQTGAALEEYQEAVKANPDMVIAHLGVGAFYVKTEQYPAAINAYETLLRKHPQTIEALVSLASIHTHLAFSFHSPSDSAASRKLAKENYDAVLRIFAQGKGAGGGDEVGGEGATKREIAKSERIRQLARDRDLYVEMARLWSDDVSVERSLKAWQEARRIQVDQVLDSIEREFENDEDYDQEVERAERLVDARIRNNIGVLLYNKRSYASSRGHFEMAFETVGKEFAEKGAELDGGVTDAVLTGVTYNLACCYEKEGNLEKAKEGWENVLRGHPEFVEAKARLALLELAGGKKDKFALDRAHVHLKEALTSQPHAPELRSLYTYFLFETFQHRQARDFARTTLKEVSRHDLYALCTSGIISYLEARENKEDSKEAQKERQARYLRSAEFFDKALQLDPLCAVAAQGLAIGLAEGSLGNAPDPAAAASTNGTNGTNATPLTDAQARQKNARDALLVFTKVKESINEASVYVNIGHCHIARDEYDKAAENYTTASKRYLNDKSSTVLWYLSRAWYLKALRESSFVDLEKAIQVGQQATDLYPSDLSNIYNMAILKQKAVEILQNKPVEAKTSAQLRKAHGYLEASDALFGQLVADTNQPTPYESNQPRFRQSYGSSLLKRFQANLDQQIAYEETEAGKVNQARQLREAEKAKQAEENARKQEEIRKQAEALAEQRKKMREEMNEQWNALSKQWVDDDDDEGGGSKKKGGAGGKRARKTKVKGLEDDASSTEEEGGEKPAKKKKAKKEKKPRKSKAAEDRQMDVDGDEDDEDAPIKAPGRRGKKGKSSAVVKSAEFIDSEEEDE